VYGKIKIFVFIAFTLSGNAQTNVVANSQFSATLSTLPMINDANTCEGSCFIRDFNCMTHPRGSVFEDVKTMVAR